MTSESINKRAINFLDEQEWSKAQELFFYNAKKHPSHKSYNNLGYYLITEGLLCKSGKVRNALKSGMKYLQKASELEKSVINYCAIAKGIDYKLRATNECEKKQLYAFACECLKNALVIEYSDSVQYNFLRFSYLLGEQDMIEILCQIRNLIQKNAFKESISLYLELLSANSMIKEGLCCIDKYGDFLDDVDKLMFYSKFGFFEKGYELCKAVCDIYVIDEFIASASVECCIATQHFDELEEYLFKIKESVNDIKQTHKEKWYDQIFDNTEISASYRKNEINNYHFCPPFLDVCCYFGCPIHNTQW